MKRIVCICLCIALSLTSFPIVFAEYNENPRNLEQDDFEKIVRRNMEHSVYALSKLDIVRNPFEKWDSDDPIKRRNAFEMVYIVRFKGDREFYKPEGVPDWFSEHVSDIATDVEPGTYDYCFLFVLDHDPLFYGRKDAEGNRVAAFDENITYYEAISLVSRLFTVFNRIRNDLWDAMDSWEEEYRDYRFAEEIGLINSNNLVNYSTLTVDESQLNEPIPAYEFMYLLYTALYIPTFVYEDYGGLPGQIRYIDYFTKAAPPEIDYDENMMYIP